MNKKFNLQNIIITIIVSWLLLFVFIPNVMIIGTSFLTRDEANLIEMTFTMDNYLRLFDPLYAKVLWHSFYMAIVATLICLVVGYPFAYIVAKMPEKWRPFMLFLIIIPFWTNSLIRTYGLKIVLGTQGILNKSLIAMDIIDKPIRIMYTENAVMIGLVYILLPFMILPLYSAIEKLDGTYLEAARDLGANKLQTLWKIVLPLTMPGIIGGCLLVLLPALGMFYISDLLGGAKNLLIGNVIKSQVLNARDWPFGAATSIALTLAMALMLYAYYRAGKLLNKKGGSRLMGRTIKFSFMSLVYLFLYLPIIVLIANSFNASKFGMKWGGFTTKWYEALLNNDSLMQAAWHSITIAVISGTAATIIGSLTAVALFRYQFKGKKFVNGLLFIVMMSPDIVMAISLLAIFLVIGFELGFLTLLIAHITFCLPFVVVTVYSRLKGFDVKMLEAARDLGASEWVILKQIILPLAKPAVASGWLLSFTLSLDDVIISSFVTGPTYEILPLKIYSMVKVGISPEVNALATVMLIVSLALVVISQLLAREKIK